MEGTPQRHDFSQYLETHAEEGGWIVGRHSNDKLIQE